MAIGEISSSSSHHIHHKSVEKQQVESDDNSDANVQESKDAVSVNISASKPDLVSSHSDGLQRAQSRFERIDQDKDGKASQDELIAIKKELNDKGRQTPGLDRVIQNFSKLDQNGDGGLQFNELHPAAGNQKPPPPPPDAAPPAPEAASAATTSVPAATQSASYSDPELTELLNVLSNSGIKGSQSFFNSNNGSSVSSSTDTSADKPADAPKAAAVDPNTAFASYYQSVLPGGSSSDALDKVVQSSVVIQSDPKGAVSQTLQYYGLKVNS